MEIEAWDERYRLGRTADLEGAANPLVVETCSKMPRGRALDLACGAGRNALWLAENGWEVTAVDGAPTAVETLRHRASQRRVRVEARVANLISAAFEIGESSWDLILMCFYLQKSLFEPAKAGVRPDGAVLAIVHIAEVSEQPTGHQLRSGELLASFADFEILHYYEGEPRDSEHKRRVAEIVARRPQK
jgi:SAM-dependent methyltransferase